MHCIAITTGTGITSYTLIGKTYSKESKVLDAGKTMKVHPESETASEVQNGQTFDRDFILDWTQERRKEIRKKSLKYIMPPAMAVAGVTV